MSSLRILLVDDEPLARKRLARLVGQCASSEIIGECGDGEAAATAIRALSPDVVLLDIRMPGLDGLSLASHLARLQPSRPLVIFTTAHADHALEAFDAAALDYLLKPIELPRLARALDRARARLADAPPAPKEPAAGSSLAALLAPPLRLTARSGDTFRLFDPAAITRLWSQDKYTAFLHDGVEQLLDESLSSLEQRLASHHFVRVHRSELVSLRRIRALHLDGDLATVELDDGQRAPVSRRYLPQLRRHLSDA